MPGENHPEHGRAARRSLRRIALTAVAALAAAACGSGPDDGALRNAAWIDAPVPAEHADGARLFHTHCSACHGPAASGSDQGPPLVHPTYLPRHHADIAFRLAITNGVRAHHWRFGDMPPVPGLDDHDIAAITAYIRWLQHAAGIL